jgi:hypothetical protein
MILIKLLIAHILGDFVLQTDKWAKHKQDQKIKSVFLYLHALVISVLSYLFVAQWEKIQILIIIFLTHLLIDIWKVYQKSTIKNFIIDQGLHVLILVVIWIFYFGSELEQMSTFILEQDFNKIWLVIFAYIFLIWPTGYIIGGITKKWQKEIDNDGLDKAGMWIGQLERILTLTFILLAQFQALGFLIAAKSILRISVKKKQERKLTEYVLIGTMLSFSISIFMGIIILFLLNKI